MERHEEREPGEQREIVCPLPAGAGAAAEPGDRVPGLQPPRVPRVPRVPAEEPRVEVHRLLRRQVSMGDAGLRDGRRQTIDKESRPVTTECLIWRDLSRLGGYCHSKRFYYIKNVGFCLFVFVNLQKFVCSG